MILASSLDPKWLSNSWLVGDRPGGPAVLIDGGAPMGPIVEALDAHRLTLEKLLCTHHHPDHVLHNPDYRARYGCAIVAHPAEAGLFRHVDEEVGGGQELQVGALRIRTLHIPGHTSGQLAFLVNDAALFTGDTLFRESVGGTRGADHTTYDDLRRSVMEVLMRLPHELAVHPGHTASTTLAHEWQHNPFVRLWRELDPPTDRPCRAFGEAARLLLEARDYDGGTKCVVRFDADQRLDVVPGSRVEAA